MAQVSRLEKKLDACFENKEFYEAHQICRTLFYRLSAAGKFEELLALLEKGCLTLTQVGEFGSAYDLSEAFAETLLKSGLPVTEQRLLSIAKIVAELPTRLDEELEDEEKDRRVKFIAGCVKWSQSVATRPSQKARGSPSLHSVFARQLHSEGRLDSARSHYMLSNDLEKYSYFMHDTYTRQTEISLELWITIDVLRLICLRRVSFARRLLSGCMARVAPSIPAPYKTSTGSTLAHFAWMLVRIVPTKNIQHFTALVAKFRPSFSVDDSIITYLDQIGQLYFGVAPKGSMMGGGMFGGLLKGLMGGGQQEKTVIACSDDEGEVEKDAESSLFQSELSLLLKGDAPAMVHQDDDLD